MASVFFSYSHADEGLRDQLEKQLALLKRQGVIETWHDRRIGAGQELNREIDAHVEHDDIILLLVSADFLASDYCYDREMVRAMERHERSEAIVIPVILRACDWHGAPFGKLMAVPSDGRPITLWSDRDQAMLEVAKAVRAAAERLPRGGTPDAPRRFDAPILVASRATMVRSSNLRLAKQFTERDKDAHKHGAFQYMAKFFENSLAELNRRNEGIEGVFRRIDANRFTAVIYRRGKSVARCTVFMSGGQFMSGIGYVAQETTDSNTYNESLTVDADEQSLFLRSMGMMRFGSGNEKLTLEGAAEFYWGILIEPLQRG